MKAASDVIEDLEFLDESLVGATEAARRSDFPNAHAMEKWLDRHGRSDLWLRFKHRDPAGTHPSGSDRKKQAMTELATHPLTALLDEAEASGVAKHARKAGRVRSLLAELKADLAADREQREALAEARSEVERLEEELQAARDRMRGAKSGKAPNAGPSAADVRAWAAERNVACSATGRVPQAVVDAYLADQDQVAS